MSLEQVISEQTAAIAANTSALTALLALWTAKPAAANLTSEIIKAACAPLPKAAAKAKAEKPAAVVAETPAPAPVVVEPINVIVVPEVAPAAVAIEYPAVMKAITDCVIRDRAHAVATLAKYNAKRGTELAAADYAAFLAELAGA